MSSSVTGSAVTAPLPLLEKDQGQQQGDSNIPKQHKACVYDKPGEISTKVVMVDTPDPGPGQVLVRLTHSGVCHSDLGIMKKAWSSLRYPTPTNQIGGHEGVGHIVKLGLGSDAVPVGGSGGRATGKGPAMLKVGDRVGIKWVSSKTKVKCYEGADGLCGQVKVSGYYTPGTFQQYCIGPANYVTPIPDNLSSAAAAPMLCAGVTSYAALRRSGAKSGQWVVIAGAGGGVGHLACQFASRAMAMRVIGLDVGSKEKFVRECGAEEFIDITKPTTTGNGEGEQQSQSQSQAEAITTQIRQLTSNLGASAVIVCTGSNTAYAQSISQLRFRGTLVCVGMPEGEPRAVAQADPQQLVALEATVTAVAVGNRRDAIEALDFAARGLVKTNLEKVVRMEELEAVFRELQAGKVQGRIVLDLQ